MRRWHVYLLQAMLFASAGLFIVLFVSRVVMPCLAEILRASGVMGV